VEAYIYNLSTLEAEIEEFLAQFWTNSQDPVSKKQAKNPKIK
jgi:hypothetical protein